MYEPGHAATTAADVVANSGFLRVGIVADLSQATIFVFLGLTLYLLLKHVNKKAASAMVILVAIATTLGVSSSRVVSPISWTCLRRS